MNLPFHKLEQFHLILLDEPSHKQLILINHKEKSSEVDFLNLGEELLNIARSVVSLQRYKGLGEMSADQLWDTTMDPETRTLLKVTEGDAIVADEVFSLLMGDVVEPRRNFIQSHALEVKNLDV